MALERKNTAIDLFSGCGGLTLGLKEADYSVIAAVELDQLSASTYKLNNPKTKIYNEDIQSIGPQKIMSELNLDRGDLDLLAGCPPCQSFSTMKTRNGQKNIEDEQSDLVFTFMNFVKSFYPKNIMLENVPGLAKNPRIKKVLKKLDSLGYESIVSVFDASDFKIPQRRRRMILLSSRIGQPKFPKKSKVKKTVANAIGRLDKPEESNDPLHNYSANHSDRIRKVIQTIPLDGGSRKELPDELQLSCHKSTDGFKDVYGRMAWSSQAPTITGGCINPSKGRFLHPGENRAITLREASILQGFPPNYKFDLSKGRYAVAQMIGNAFPPNFAKMQALELQFKDHSEVLNT